MNISKEFLELLRDRLSIVDVIGRCVALRRNGKEHWGICPFHGEKTASFSVNEDKRFYHCFGCGAHGDIIGFTMQFHRLPFIEAVERLASEAGLDMPDSTPEQRERDMKSRDMYEVLELAAGFFRESLFAPEGAAALAYLKRRGLSDEIMSGFRLCYAPPGNRLLKFLEGRRIPLRRILDAGLARMGEKTNTPYDYFRDRVLFPISDSRGRIVAFGGRVMDDSLPKYLNSPESIVFSKGRTLYALALARMEAAEKNEVIATEGYMDAIAMHQFGFRNAVAPLGTAITETQIDLLWKLADEPVLCFDSDEAGRRAGLRAALRALPILRPGKSLKFCLIEGAKDPDEYLRTYGRDKFAGQIAGARPLSDILWGSFTAGRRIETPEARAGLQQEIAREFSRINNEAVRKFYMDEFALRMGREFSRVQSARKPARIRANPDNPNEKMVLAFAVCYPSMFFKFLEEGRAVELSHPVYKKIFDVVKAELALRPHTRETMMGFLNERGFHPENLLRFEIDSLVAKPAAAEMIMREKLELARRGNLAAELKNLNAELMSAPAASVPGLRARIRNLGDEIADIDAALDELGELA